MFAGNTNLLYAGEIDLRLEAERNRFVLRTEVQQQSEISCNRIRQVVESIFDPLLNLLVCLQT